MVTRITPEEARRMMDTQKDIVILDVRRQEEYEVGHIPGSKLLPLADLESEVEFEVPDYAQRILVYCRSGNRSAAAAEILRRLGYEDIWDFGGIISWPYEVVKE